MTEVFRPGAPSGFGFLRISGIPDRSLEPPAQAADHEAARFHEAARQVPVGGVSHQVVVVAGFLHVVVAVDVADLPAPGYRARIDAPQRLLQTEIPEQD